MHSSAWMIKNIRLLVISVLLINIAGYYYYSNIFVSWERIR